MARGPMGEKIKDVYVGIRLPRDLVEALDTAAHIEYRTRSNLIEVLIRECFDKHIEERKRSGLLPKGKI